MVEGMPKEERIGLGLEEIPPEASNDLNLESSFTQKDFEDALAKVFPFTEELQADQESSKT